MKPLLHSAKLRDNVIIGFILAYTFILFSKAINFEFVLWDDNYYVTDNLLIRDFSVEGIKKILVTPVYGMYNPVPFLLYALIYKFRGLDPSAFHFFNIIFHLLGTITIYKFIKRLTHRYETAAIVALLFAIHPMHVSVVTWVSELKTSMYLIFYFLALTRYLKYIEQDYKMKHLVYAALLFILAALSKPSVVTLAPMLFLLDYYLGRKPDKRLFLEKIPFFVIAIFWGIITLLTHAESGDPIFDVNLEKYSLINNILISNYSVAFYIEKLIYPVNLCTIYPYPENTTFLPIAYYLTIPVIPFILWLVYRSGKFKKEMIFGILFFVIAISVLLRIVPSGFFGMANWYTYLSYTGMFFIIGQYFTYVLDNKFTYAKKIKKYLIALLCIGIIFFTYSTTIRIKVWQNSITLFNDVIKKRPKVAGAYNNRAIAKRYIGDIKGSIEDCTKAIELDPASASFAYYNRALAKKDLRDLNGSIEDCTKAIELAPGFSLAYNTRALAKNDLGNINGAMDDYNKAIEYNPKFYLAYYNRAMLKKDQGNFEGAIEDFTKTIEYSPQNFFAYNDRGEVKRFLGNENGALQDYKMALAINPKFASPYNNIGLIKFNHKNYEEALNNYNRAIMLNPKIGAAYHNRASIKLIQGDTIGAIEDWKKAASLGIKEDIKRVETFTKARGDK